MAGYGVGCFLGIAEALNGPKQDNFTNPNLAIRKIDTNAKGTTIRFRYYTEKGFWFTIAHDSYLTANGKKYKLTAADGVKLDENNKPQIKAYSVRVKYGIDINYCDFALTFEPFDTIPTTFDFKAGDGEDVFVIRNVSLKESLSYAKLFTKVKTFNLGNRFPGSAESFFVPFSVTLPNKTDE